MREYVQYHMDLVLATVSPLLIVTGWWTYYLVIGLLWALFCSAYSNSFNPRTFLLHLIGWIVLVPYSAHKWIKHNRGM